MSSSDFPCGFTANPVEGSNSVRFTDKSLSKPDYLDKFAEGVRKKEIDPSVNFSFRLIGKFDESGSVIADDSEFVDAEGDDVVIKFAQSRIVYMDGKGWFRNLLDEPKNQEFQILARQDDKQSCAGFIVFLENDSRAKSVASGLKGIWQIAIAAHKRGIRRIGEVEYELLRAARVTSKDATVSIELDLPKEKAQKLLLRSLEQYREYRSRRNVSLSR